jgi:hypothetical protein
LSSAARLAAALVLAACSGAAPAAAVPYTFRSIADQTGPVANFGGAPVINDAGDVAFVASLDDGTQGIFSGPDPGTDTIADDSGPYDAPLDFPSIAADGTVAFRASLDPTPELVLGGRGIFTGPDPDFDTVADDTGTDFGDFDWPSITDGGTVAFGAILPAGSFAVFWSRTRRGPMRPRCSPPPLTARGRSRSSRSSMPAAAGSSPAMTR